ncbi:hypothetical protein [Mycobacterium uberis]|uniref:hypothetical protein n=1 Tax=Mycobacterium uberis TaxID=2162698 RepID=UPI001FB1FFC8|nr:hypothetical protein [Mycobacterium uberis]
MYITLVMAAAIFGIAKFIDSKSHLEGAVGPVALITANLVMITFGMSWGPVV